jgi:hypothetical protein
MPYLKEFVEEITQSSALIFAEAYSSPDISMVGGMITLTSYSEVRRLGT